MKERPINLTADEVRAVLAGRKTQMRRVIKWKPRPFGYNLSASAVELGHYMTGQPDSGWVLRSLGAGECWNDRTYPFKCPYFPGQRLWVREAYLITDSAPYDDGKTDVVIVYRADGDTKDDRWSSSVHMPRWASRITLEVTDVRIQRVQDITEADAESEGVTGDDALIGQISNPFRTAFADIWNSINLKRGHGWDANPWVAAVTWRWLT